MWLPTLWLCAALVCGLPWPVDRWVFGYRGSLRGVFIGEAGRRQRAARSACETLYSTHKKTPVAVHRGRGYSQGKQIIALLPHHHEQCLGG